VKRFPSQILIPKSQIDEVFEKKNGNEEWYGGKEKARDCIYQRKIVTVQNDTF